MNKCLKGCCTYRATKFCSEATGLAMMEVPMARKARAEVMRTILK